VNRIKVVGLRDLTRIVRSLKRRKKTVVFTNGCFDILHAGHVRYLRRARSLGDALILGVNTDASVRRLKGPGRPLVSLRHRLEVLSSLEPVDYLVPFAQETPERIIQALTPDILVKGADYREHEIAGSRHVKQRGGSVVRIPLVRGLSTSGLLCRIRGRQKS
jgi:D-beta-D-heptose 7-phosphate kinase/D-beta-D-heptose 1-phosphate adenosyltransferase